MVGYAAEELSCCPPARRAPEPTLRIGRSASSRKGGAGSHGELSQAPRSRQRPARRPGWALRLGPTTALSNTAPRCRFRRGRQTWDILSGRPPDPANKPRSCEWNGA